MYGGDLGWTEFEVEKIQERYLKWTLGFNRETLGHIVREETKRGKIASRSEKESHKIRRTNRRKTTLSDIPRMYEREKE